MKAVLLAFCLVFIHYGDTRSEPWCGCSMIRCATIVMRPFRMNVFVFTRMFFIMDPAPPEPCRSTDVCPYLYCPCDGIFGVYAPVCASDLRTYTNDCEMSCESTPESRLFQFHQGNCKKCASPLVYAPVCAHDFEKPYLSKYKTFSNKCEAGCHVPDWGIFNGPCESLAIE